MPVITVGSVKGGVGKTTVATNLAILFSQDEPSRDVLLVDADFQETTSDFTELRADALGDAGYTCIQLAGMQIKSQVRKLRDKYRTVLIDAGGRDSVSQRAAISVSDFLLVPFLPRSFDLWTVDALLSLVDETLPINEDLRTFFFLNRGDPFGTDMDESYAYLREKTKGRHDTQLLEESLGTRKAFAQAASSGLGVTEIRPRDAKASEEMTALYTSLATKIQNVYRKKAHA